MNDWCLPTTRVTFKRQPGKRETLFIYLNVFEKCSIRCVMMMRRLFDKKMLFLLMKRRRFYREMSSLLFGLNFKYRWVGGQSWSTEENENIDTKYTFWILTNKKVEQLMDLLFWLRKLEIFLIKWDCRKSYKRQA